VALTERFDSARSSFVLNATQLGLAQKGENTVGEESERASNKSLSLFIPDDEDQNGDGISARTQDTITDTSVFDLLTTFSWPRSHPSACGADFI
jgi:hypothetical protein